MEKLLHSMIGTINSIDLKDLESGRIDSILANLSNYYELVKMVEHFHPKYREVSSSMRCIREASKRLKNKAVHTTQDIIKEKIDKKVLSANAPVRYELEDLIYEYGRVKEIDPHGFYITTIAHNNFLLELRNTIFDEYQNSISSDGLGIGFRHNCIKAIGVINKIERFLDIPEKDLTQSLTEDVIGYFEARSQLDVINALNLNV